MSVLFSKKTISTFAAVAFSIIILAVFLGTTESNSITTDKPDEIKYTPVKVIRAEKGSLDRTLRLNGYIQSDDIVTIIPFVSGTLEELLVDVGETVSENQVIARIDSRVFDLQLKQAEAAYLGAKSSYERLELLYASNAATRQNYDQAKTQYEAYKSQYELARLQLSYTEIESPINGTVLAIHANQGSIAAPELPVLTVGDLTNLIVKLSIPDRYYELFRTSPDMRIKIFRPGNEASAAEASIKNISPIISPETRNFEVVCTIDGDKSVFRPGMFVYCLFNVDHAEDVFYLPHKALGPSGTLWYINPQSSTAERIDFAGYFSNNNFFAIPEELAHYDFIIEGQSFLTPGERVRIK